MNVAEKGLFWLLNYILFIHRLFMAHAHIMWTTWNRSCGFLLSVFYFSLLSLPSWDLSNPRRPCLLLAKVYYSHFNSSSTSTWPVIWISSHFKDDATALSSRLFIQPGTKGIQRLVGKEQGVSVATRVADQLAKLLWLSRNQVQLRRNFLFFYSPIPTTRFLSLARCACKYPPWLPELEFGQSSCALRSSEPGRQVHLVPFISTFHWVS